MDLCVGCQNQVQFLGLVERRSVFVAVVAVF
jgi:hypothetical protein